MHSDINIHDSIDESNESTTIIIIEESSREANNRTQQMSLFIIFYVTYSDDINWYHARDTEQQITRSRSLSLQVI